MTNMINLNPETTTIHLPKQAEQYTLCAQTLRSTTMTINGLPLKEPEDLQNLPKQTQREGNIELAPGTCTFFVL